jgi:hypothetical protein
MSTHGDVNVFDFVQQMQLRGDFQTCQIMFDHVKCVNEWTTLACHVYDLIYCNLMTIAVRNM